MLSRSCPFLSCEDVVRDRSISHKKRDFGQGRENMPLFKIERKFFFSKTLFY